MEALEALRTRRSTRAYRPDPVNTDLIETVLEAGRRAPTGGNSRTNHFFVIRDQEILQKLNRMARKAFAAMEVNENTYRSLRNSILASKNGNYVFTYNAPVLIVVANRKGYGNNIADVACALENMMIAANDLDLGSCWINQLKWLNEDPEILAYLETLGLKENERVYGSLALGYPLSADGLPERKPLPETGNEVTWL